MRVYIIRQSLGACGSFEQLAKSYVDAKLFLKRRAHLSEK
jgi:hypothetical protein